jgi:hypothetical protein
LCSIDLSEWINSTKRVVKNHFIQVKHCVVDVSRVWNTESITVIKRTTFITKSICWWSEANTGYAWSNKGFIWTRKTYEHPHWNWLST